MHTLFLHQHVIEYRNESSQKPPLNLVEAHQTSAETILQAAKHHTATIWRGDFHQGKQLLSALKKRVRKPAKSAATPAETFHKHRLAQSQQSREINMLLVEIGTNFHLNLPRAPDVQAALQDVYGELNQQPFLLPLNQLLGFIGAHEWHKRGVAISALNQQRIHVPFGVFSPLRGEYLDLVAHTRLPEPCMTAFDIGTGSGVLAAILAQRGVPHIIATDNNPRAISCARANVERLNFSHQIHILQQDYFPDGQADLMICNPPWLPAKPTSAVETALYDPQHTMLHHVLRNAATHLTEQGELWLIMSDLAEHLGLRETGSLNTWFQQYGWHIATQISTTPTHQKASDPNDVLAFARQKERTFLYCLQPV